jgi:S-methylmethionine-dependent homocysteine/selenocysteine methylase
VAFDDPRQRLDTIVEALAAFEPAGIAVMHSPPEDVGPAIEWLRQYWGGPIGAYAEVPYPEGPQNDTRDSVSVDRYAALAAEWLAQGAAMIGGCCGTTPAHIAAVARTIRSG